MHVPIISLKYWSWWGTVIFQLIPDHTLLFRRVPASIYYFVRPYVWCNIWGLSRHLYEQQNFWHISLISLYIFLIPLSITNLSILTSIFLSIPIYIYMYISNYLSIYLFIVYLIPFSLTNKHTLFLSLAIYLKNILLYSFIFSKNAVMSFKDMGANPRI